MTWEELGKNSANHVTWEDVSDGVKKFTDAHSREDVVKAAEQWVIDTKSSVHSFIEAGGIMNIVIRHLLQNGDFSPRGGGWSHAPLDDEGGSQLGLFDTVQGALMVHFGFTECSVPPKMVVRELIALMVRQGQLITSLADELDLPSDTMTHVFHAAFDRALIGKLDTPEDAFLMDGEAIERFVACFQGGNWSGPRWID